MLSKEPLLTPSDQEGCQYAGGTNEAKKTDLEQNRRYKNNAIRTSKYTWLTFVPKNLLSQFSKSANVYFLLIVLAQMIDDISITDGKPMNAPPLALVVLVSMIKDAYEDYKR